MAARVLLVEPNRILREGVKAELSRSGAIEVVGEAATVTDAVSVAQELLPDVVVLDSNAAGASVAEACEALAAVGRVIVLADRGDESHVAAAVDGGARSYLLKDADDLDLAGAVRRVLAGESVIDPRATAALIDSHQGGDRPKLSRQEIKVLRLVAEGLTNPEIGARLYLSRHTVKEYLSHAMRKLEATNRIEAVRRATELGVIEGSPRPEPDTVAYNVTGEPARSADLKVTPLKLDQLRGLRRQSR